MKMLRTSCLTLLITACTPIAAFAGQITVGYIKGICSSPDPQHQTSCRFYIRGVLDGVAFGRKRKCAADDSGDRQYIADNDIGAVLNHVEHTILGAYPKDDARSATEFIVEAACAKSEE